MNRAEPDGFEGFQDEVPQERASTGFSRSMMMSESRLSESLFDNTDVELEEGNEESNEAVREVNAVAKKEIAGVKLSKCLFLFLVLVTAGLVSAGTYVFMKDEEDDDYELSYDQFSIAMKDAVDVHVEHIYLGFESMANFISSNAALNGETFPFHTTKNFEAEGESVRKFSRAEIFGFCPFVEVTQVPQWMNYSNTNQGWLETSRQWALRSGESTVVTTDYQTGPITPIIYDLGGPGGTPQPAQTDPPYAPMWQTSPPVFNPQTINLDCNFFEFTSTALGLLREIREGFFTRILVAGETGAMTSLIWKPDDHQAFHESFVDWNKTALDASETAHGAFIQPVFEDPLDSTSKLVGYLIVALAWDAYLTNLLPDGVEGLYCVVKNTCGQSLTYRLTGNKAYFMGRGDFHETAYDSTEYVIPFDKLRPDNYDPPEGQCIFSFHIYSSKEFEDTYRSNVVVLLTCIVAGAFCFLIASYFMYDWFVRRRNSKIVLVAAKASEIVSSLFPRNVRDRLYEENTMHGSEHGQNTFKNDFHNEEKLRLNTEANQQLSSGSAHDQAMDDEGFMYKSSPIADLYADTTIMFADIAGFTSWSSTREPSQVFTLLETLYKAFDTIAKRRRVFKVETIGDCYVAVAGLPEPMKDHSVVMCRFAKDCLHKMRESVQRLESVLGPDTMELDMRFGLHSGSVTAGVLRGEKSRFQLFGDTMNTASRMESTGRKGMVQVSQQTADLLKAAGKKHWLRPRQDKVNAKGKGELQTYWVTTRSSGSDAGLSMEDSGHNTPNFDDSEYLSFHDETEVLEGDTTDLEKEARLVKWNVEVMRGLLEMIAKTRPTTEAARMDRASESDVQHGPALGEMKESISFPPLDVLMGDGEDGMQVPYEAIEQLEDFISSLAVMYGDHPYHNFTHASHVTLSVVKMFSQLNTDPTVSGRHMSSALLLSLDPVAQLACVFAALLQDLGHTGVPNFIFAKEDSSIAEKYGGRCVAEQKSVDSVWSLLMESKYEDLREAIYHTEAEKKHFRQVFVHCLLSTDLVDKEFAESRKERWEKGFGISTNAETKAKLDLQTTLLLESIVQASDMIHTMQHWDVYSKWNTCLFKEVYRAYTDGRIDSNPAESWYKGELTLIDNLVLPLTERLSECKVFKPGTINAYIDFANSNRTQWAHEGESIVSELVEKDAAKSGE